MNRPDLVSCEESIARGDECTFCGAKWHEAVERELHHTNDCRYDTFLAVKSNLEALLDSTGDDIFFLAVQDIMEGS